MNPELDPMARLEAWIDRQGLDWNGIDCHAMSRLITLWQEDEAGECATLTMELGLSRREWELAA